MQGISTHTPLAGRDKTDLNGLSMKMLFLLTRPLRDVTGEDGIFTETYYISTHTPLAGRDPDGSVNPFDSADFYSHAPCGT